jgi:hypothetical protein
MTRMSTNPGGSADKPTRTNRYLAAGALVFAAFLSSYGYAAARSGAATPGGAPAAGAPQSGPAGASAVAPAGAGCACCGGGGSSAVLAGEASVEGGVQRITVDASTGSWAPNEIVLKAGVPAEITFTQGTGCLAQVVFSDLGLSADLTNGGAVVRIPALGAGEHRFSCGMSMVFGRLVVR